MRGMLTRFNKSAHLLDMLLMTVNGIARSDAKDKQRIANAYRDACSLAAAIALNEKGSTRPRILACYERFQAYKSAGDVAAAGWMLAAIRERAAEHDLYGWRALMRIIDDTIRMLPAPGKTALH